MRLHSLKIRNFRVLRAVDLVFDDAVIGIIGNNGTGKSSIVEAISWVLYGHQAARSTRSEIKSSLAAAHENCEVTLDFSVNGESYRVIRTLVGKRERAEVQLYRGEASESVGVTETRRYVGELLGLDWRGFLTSFLARQQELNALSDLPPARRRDHLAGMLGIERLDRVIARVKEESRLDREKAELLSGRLGESDQLEKRIAELSKRRVELTQVVSSLEVRNKEAEEALRHTTSEYSILQKSHSEWSQYTAQLGALEKSLRQLELRREQLAGEADRLSAQAAEANVLKERVTELPVLKGRLDDLKAVRGRLESHRQLSTQASDLKGEREQLLQSLQAARTQAEQLTAELGRIPENIDEKSSEALGKLEQAREDFTRHREQRAALISEKSRLTDQMNQIAQLGPESTCDRCLRPLGDDLPGIRRHLEDEMVALAQQERESQVQLQKLKADGSHLKEHSDQLQASLSQRRELLIKLEAATRREGELGRREEDIGRRQAEVTARLEKIGPVAYDEKMFAQVAEQVAHCEQEETQLNRLLGALARQPQVEKELTDLKSSRIELERDIADLTSEREALGFSDARFEVVRSRFEQAQTKLEEVRRKHVAGQTQLEVTAVELEAQAERLADLNKIRE